MIDQYSMLLLTTIEPQHRNPICLRVLLGAADKHIMIYTRWQYQKSGEFDGREVFCQDDET